MIAGVSWLLAPVILAAAAGGLRADRASPAWQVALLEDPGGRLGIEDVAGEPASKRFTPAASLPINLAYSPSTWWLRLDLDLPAGVEYVLEVGYPQIDRLTLYLPEDRAWRIIEAGDTSPAAHRPVRYPSPVFVLPEGFNGQAFLRVESRGAILLPLQLREMRAFLEHAGRAQFGYGLYYAFLLALLIYNFFLFASIRDAAYLWYVLYLAGLLLFQGSLTGHAALWLWPDSPQWANHATVFGVAVMLTAGILFVMRMAETRRFSPYWHRALQGCAGAAVLLPVLLLLDFRYGSIGATVVGAGILVLLPVPIALNYLRGCRTARFVLLGILAFLPGGVLFVLRLLGALPATWWTEHALQAGTAAEVMLLSFALADRINLLHGDKQVAQRALLNAQEEARRAFAQDLHDGLGQNLLALSNRVKRLRDRGGDLGDLQEHAAASLQELRRIARTLHPDAVDRLGLKAAVESMLEQTLPAAGIAYRYEADDVSLPRRDAVQVFRIAQEAINNVLRHAGATAVTVRMEAGNGVLSLQITDNGAGIPAHPGAGLGLAGMRERADYLEGTVNVARRREGGTAVILHVPMHGRPDREEREYD